MADELPKGAWLVSKLGRLTAGVQYEPLFGSKGAERYKNLRNWSCAIGYGLGSGSPLSPSFNFGLELARSSQVFEISPALYVVELRNSYGDSSVYRQLCKYEKRIDSLLKEYHHWKNEESNRV